MHPTSRMLLVVLLVLLTAGAVFAQSAETPKAAWPAYGLAIFLGFGTGHWYLGESGTAFLIGDAGGMALMVGGYVYMAAALFNSASSGSFGSSASTITTGTAVMGVGALVYAVSRIWEIVDIFGTTERVRQAGRVADLQPVIEARPQGVSFALCYEY